MHSFRHLLWPAFSLLSLSPWWLPIILDSKDQARGGDTVFPLIAGWTLSQPLMLLRLLEILRGVSENESGWQHDFQETTSPIFQSLKESCFSVGRMVICFPSWVFYPMTFKWLLSIPSHSWELHSSYTGSCSLPFPLWSPLSIIFLLRSLSNCQSPSPFKASISNCPAISHTFVTSRFQPSFVRWFSRVTSVTETRYFTSRQIFKWTMDNQHSLFIFWFSFSQETFPCLG